MAVWILFRFFLILNDTKIQHTFWHKELDILRMTMKIFLLFFVVTFCSGFSVDTFVGTVMGVKQHYRSGCVYLLHSQQIGETHYVKIVFVSAIFRDNSVNLIFTN